MTLYHETYDARCEMDAAEIGDHADVYLDLARKLGGPVLELGAGTARISRRLAREGIETTALELSPEMIGAGELWGDEVPEDLFTIIEGDVRHIPELAPPALVIAPFRMLQELPGPDDVEKCLASVRNVMRGDGIFCFDMIDPDGMPSLLRNDPAIQRMPDVIHPGTGTKVRVTACERIAEPRAQRYRERWLFELEDSAGRVIRRDEHWQRHCWYSRREVAAMLSRVGYGGAVWYGEYEDVKSARPRRPGRHQV